VTLAPKGEWTRAWRGTATLQVDKSFPAHPLGAAARAWLVTERGSNVQIEEFAEEKDCTDRAAKVASCHLVFAVRGNSIVEVHAGGAHSFAYSTCAYHATRWLKEHYGA
jgi:hypothetical protein